MTRPLTRRGAALTMCFALILLLSSLSSAQRLVDMNKGDHNETKKGFMDGNLVSTVYYNFGEVADWQNEASRSGVWPKGTTHTYVDGVAIIVQAEATDPAGTLIHPLETNYYEYTRYDVGTGVTYGWWPLPGYANRFQSSPAQSTDPITWPTHWPDRTSEWDGKWNGFFGRGVQNADLETYFVFDDNEDREYIIKNNFRPDAADSTRGGLGMQVRARGFQWSQVLAEDVIFWLYEITNMGTTDYRKTLFAEYVDWGIGGHDNSSNNSGNYNTELDLSYAWSTVPFGSPGNWSPVGLCGYAFLESPGIRDDHRDNDRDGLTDERRDNAPSIFISTPLADPYLVDVLQDTARFRQFYGYAWRPHWDADENGNWRSYTDINQNGQPDAGEPINDDVGSDGIGPLDNGYVAADADSTEGNGMPDQGEPNFGVLDKDESDQLGLTGFLIAAAHTYDLNDDERNWGMLSAQPPPIDAPPTTGVNLTNFFSSYLFHLNGRNTYSAQTGQLQQTGETERFSMALIFGLNADDLFRRKRTVQQIYNASYRFAKPPDKPTVKAIAGDHRVTLYWDDRAEKTFDAFYQKYNFEGYRIYRSTEPNFLEDKIITDAYGRPTYRLPIAQFDLVDGVKGLHPIDVEGALFYLGNDVGLQHSLIDSTVTNGQTYYYAVVPYDQGFTTTTINGEFLGIPPTEATSIIKVDVNGRVKTDINTAVVTPRAPASGYIAPEIVPEITTGPGTGSVGIDMLDPDSIKESHRYRLGFTDSTAFHDNPRPYYSLVDMTTGDTLLGQKQMISGEEQTPIVDGFTIKIVNDMSVAIDQKASRWTKGNSTYVVQLGFDSRYAPAYQTRRINYPADFDVIFTNDGAGDLSFPSSSFSGPEVSNITITNVTEGIEHFQFIFRDNDLDSKFTDGDAIFLVCGDSAGKRATTFAAARKSWSVTFILDTLIPPSQQIAPQPGDVYHIATTKPFRTGEYTEFVTHAQSSDSVIARRDLAKVAVVPNPYVGAASWEPLSTSVGRGERRLFFTHLPANCTIRIYSISGQLVQTIRHDAAIDDGQEPWNLVSKDGMDIAYGVYVFHIETENLGSIVGKFAVIK